MTVKAPWASSLNNSCYYYFSESTEGIFLKFDLKVPIVNYFLYGKHIKIKEMVVYCFLIY